MDSNWSPPQQRRVRATGSEHLRHVLVSTLPYPLCTTFLCFLIQLTSRLNPLNPPKLHNLSRPPFIYIICHHFPHSTQSVTHLKLLRECARSSICGFSFEVHRSTDASVRLAVNSCVMCFFHLHPTPPAPLFFAF